MKISGFTIIRNGEEYDYPYLESLRSLLPLVDELIINVGEGTDQTLQKIQKFATEEGEGKVSLFTSHWPLDDPEKKKGGKILSEQTNLALDRCTGDWCIYLQADEVFHEGDSHRLRSFLEKYADHPDVEALVFSYRHFYGSYDIIQESRSAYRREVRAVKRAATPRSVGDAQSFRKPDGSKLKSIYCGARVFHYGWVRTPEAMKEKTFFMDQLYHGSPSDDQNQTRTPHSGENYRYKRFWGLKRFKETHPAVMQSRIQEKGWNWDFEASSFVWTWKDWPKILLDTFERLSGIRLFEYRSYDLLKEGKLKS